MSITHHDPNKDYYGHTTSQTGWYYPDDEPLTVEAFPMGHFVNQPTTDEEELADA